VALRWGVQRGLSLVPKSSKPDRLKQNLELFSFDLDSQEMQAIGKLDRGRRYNDPGVFAEGMGAFLPIYD
jgi:D-xylose reductase